MFKILALIVKLDVLQNSVYKDNIGLVNWQKMQVFLPLHTKDSEFGIIKIVRK